MERPLRKRLLCHLAAGFAVVLLTPVAVAIAVSLPTASTGKATAITAVSAVLPAAIYPGDQMTQYYFQYGPGPEYGLQTPTTIAGTGKATIHVSALLTGLVAFSTYHYRVVAINGSGTIPGADRIFTTKKIPLTFTLSAPPSPLFAAPFSITGSLSGTGSGGRQIVAEEQQPAALGGGFAAVGKPFTTEAEGGFRLRVAGLRQKSKLRVSTIDSPVTRSAVITIIVRVRVSIHVRSSGRQGVARISGTVTPAEQGAHVILQRVGSGVIRNIAQISEWRNKPVSRFSDDIRIRRPGLYRAYVQINGGDLASNGSRAVLIR